MSVVMEAGKAVSLGRHWRQWTSAVAAVAQQRRSRAATSEGFAAVRQDVLAACRQAAAAAVGEEKQYYEYLEGLVAPWGSLEALARADREIQLDLLLRCQEADRRLNGGRGGAAGGRLRWKLSLAALTAVAFAAAWAAEHFTGALTDLSDRLGRTWRELSDADRFLALGAGVGLVSLVLMVVFVRK